MSLATEQQGDLVTVGNIDVNAHLELVLNGENDEEICFNNYDDYYDNIICYDSDADSSQEYDADDVGEKPYYEITSETQNTFSETSSDIGTSVIIKKKSNAAQMRKYRAKQRSDPERYRIYLERERVRNNRRKYEKRVKAAQDQAIQMGLNYIVLEPFTTTTRRGRKPKYPSHDSFILPVNFENQASDSLYTDPHDEMHSIPVKVELTESDVVTQEHKPHISVVNIDKLTNRPRSALQTLLPQELNDRERMSNFIKLDHDYVRIKTEPIDEYVDNLIKINQHSTMNGSKMANKKSNKMNRDDLMKLQEQCRNFISLKSTTASSSNGRKRRSSKKHSGNRRTADLMQNDSGEHEDLDDLFKELEEVANKEEPKKKKSKTSPGKQRHSEFSLTVQMPVQPIIPPKSENKDDNSHLEDEISNGSKIDNICDDEMRWWKRILRQEGFSDEHKEDDFIENIKKESFSSDDFHY